ncbi:MAG: sigma-54-dependent Fis family transcriptional regulator [Alphaproteobacteria bacterium]|nr:MAG: sigma-54-dependent Fis family transcriptional regulator [Alphaproteobacteria bacterium]
MSRGRILVVDDDADLLGSTCDWLAASGFAVDAAAGGGEALAILSADQARAVDVLVTDIRMPGIDGMALLDRARRLDPELPVVLLTGHGDVALAVEAMRAGAHDFLEKPYNAEHLVAVLDRAIGQRRLARENRDLRVRVSGGDPLEGRLIGSDASMVELRRRIAHLADFDVDVLIIGETGTGKEVVARALHDCGKRRDRPFVAINCGAVPETIFESEIFGHERGAFTGAVARRVGKIEYADGGTVFLDEIESMPPGLQTKLLRLLQERVVEPLGGNRQLPIDVRFLAATKVDLRAAAAAGTFRSDLYYRLATVELELKPLRGRRGDIPLLFHHFVRAAAGRHGVDVPAIPAATLAELATAPLEGNVRQLRAEAERYVLGYGLNRERPGGSVDAATLSERVGAFEAGLIREALAAADGRVAEAAMRLGVPRRTLAEKIARYRLKPEESGPGGPWRIAAD